MQFKNKVLIIGPDFFGYNESIANAFRKNNWNADVINYFDGRSMTSYQLLLSIFNSRYYFDVNKFCLKSNYDLILIVKGTKISSDKINELKKHCKHIYLWIMDPIKLFPDIYEKLSSFEKIFTFQKTDMGYLSNYNSKVFYLPLFYDDTIFGLTKKAKFIDFIFIGNLYEQRGSELNKFCKDVIESKENLNIQIYGGFGLLKILNFFKIKKQFKYLSEFLKFGLVSPKKAANLYANSKIGINIHVHSQTGLNMRFFELLGSGVIQILPNCKIDLDEIEVSKDTYVCSELNIKEIMKIIKSDFDRRTEFTMSNHSSTNRIKELIDEFNN